MGCHPIVISPFDFHLKSLKFNYCHDYLPRLYLTKAIKHDEHNR